MRQALKEPIEEEREVAEFNKKVMGKTFGRDAAVVQSVVGEMTQVQLLELKRQLEEG